VEFNCRALEKKKKKSGKEFLNFKGSLTPKLKFGAAMFGWRGMR
jgi:hypothetical protein